MNNDFIEQIEIKQFKCFKNFKADGFGRVNLIGGKNNVGKTAFMEACLLSRAESTEDLYKKLLEIQTHRDAINQLLSTTDRQQDLRRLIMDNALFSIYRKSDKLERLIKRAIHVHYQKSQVHNNSSHTEAEISYTNRCGKVEVIKNNDSGYFEIYTRNMPFEEIHKGKKIVNKEPEKHSYSEIFNILDISLINVKYINDISFISLYSNSDLEIIDTIGQIKLDNKYDILNGYLNEVFNVEVIDIIKNKPMLKTGNQYSDLSRFGQGIKSFINIIGSILLLKDSVLFIDEIENGIHYSHFSRLWGIILTLSKQQNVQIFATTHSKECIDTYARVSKRLEDKDITFIEFGRDRQKKITSITYDFKAFTTEIEQDQELRGW